MTEENNVADIQPDDEENIESEEENENSESSPDESNEDGDGQSPDGQQGANNQEDPDKDKPFHEHPRWKKREEEWESRFNDQEKRHVDAIQAIREEFGNKREANAAQEKPVWFGGTDEQWDAYRADRDKELASAATTAVKSLESVKQNQDKAVKDATDFMQSEITAIESDKKLNPTGAKIDPNKLLKIVMDNDLIDSKGNWNYRAGFKLMGPAKAAPNNIQDRKALAGATTSESKGESKPANYKTSEDFKKKKPW